MQGMLTCVNSHVYMRCSNPETNDDLYMAVTLSILSIDILIARKINELEHVEAHQPALKWLIYAVKLAFHAIGNDVLSGN